MNEQDVAKGLARLRHRFPESDTAVRPEIWCHACNHDACLQHYVGVCLVCGEHGRSSHDHITYVPIVSLRKRFNQIDPNWSWEPMAVTEQGAPLIERHGPNYDALWINLTICGVTHSGVGQARPGDVYGPAGLLSTAISNAASQFGCGDKTRAGQAAQRRHEVQPLVGETVTAHNTPEQSERPGKPHWSVEATDLVTRYALTMAKVNRWRKAHMPDLKVGNIPSAALLKIGDDTGSDLEDVAIAIDMETPLPTDEEE